MRKIIIFVLIFLGLTALSSNQAAAVVTLSFQPSTQRVNVGDSFTVDLVVSGLGNGVAPSVKVFDIDITFDASVISFESVDFGPFLGDPSNPSETIINFDDQSPNYVWLAETSLLSAPALHALQGSSFTLATMEFTALTAGSITISGDLYALRDTADNDLIFAHGPVDSASVDVNIPVDGYIHHVREPGPVSKTYIEVIIGEDFEGTLPDDIASIEVTVTDSNGVTTPLTLPSYEYFDQWRDFFFVIDGPPDLGVYTFTVTSTPATGSLRGSDTDHQYTKIDIPNPDTATFSPVNGATITSKTPSFSWDPVELPGVPLYYRLIIDDGGGNRVYSTGRVFGMTSHTVPEGELNPGQTYYWRVRVTDAADYEYMQNRASHVANADPAAGKLSFTMANTLTHNNQPFIFPDDWTTVTYSREYGNATSCWIRIKDHDGVASDGSSHQVEVTLPGGGGTQPMEHDRTDGPDVVAYSYWSNDPPQSGQYTFRVTDPDGNVGTLVENFTYDPLPLPDENSITPNVKAEYITARFDNVYINGDLATAYEDFESYPTPSINEIDWDKWAWYHNAEIREEGGNKYLELDIGNSVGRASGTLSFVDPLSIYAIKADILIENASTSAVEPRAEIRGTWCHNGNGEIAAKISVSKNRVWAQVGEEFINEQGTYSWNDVLYEEDILPTGDFTVNPVTVEIFWDEPNSTFTFTANGTSKEYTVLGVLGPPVFDTVKTLRTRINLITDTTPTFSFNPVARAVRYRVKIYNWDNSQTIWNGYPGGTSATVPPGILQPNAYYRFRLEALDAHSPQNIHHSLLNVDNVSKTPASNDDNYIFYTGSVEDDHPFIRLRSAGVEVWNNELLEPSLVFFTEVYDVDGVGPDTDPDNNIDWVKVIFPDGTTEEFLEYRSDFSCCPPTPTSSIYHKASSKAIQAGTYTFIVRDKDGNEYQKTEELTPDPIGYPLEVSLRPLDGTVIGSTEMHFDWEDVEDAPGVPAAAFYWIQIYDHGFNRIYTYGTTESELHLAAGFLEEKALYRWRVQARREFFSENVDNGSSAPASFYSMPTFVTTEPTDSDGDGLPDWWENQHGVSDPNGDADTDGLTNEQEYHLATDPNDDDTDGDGRLDGADGYPLSGFAEDTDFDGIMDDLDLCPLDPENDIDEDGVCGNLDNCPYLNNPGQADLNGDGWGDVCDDIDGDLVNDDQDVWPIDPDNDLDGDGFGADPFDNCLQICEECSDLAAICNTLDNCPGIPNDQTDSDGDGTGDECDIAVGGAPPGCHPKHNPCDPPIDDSPAEDDTDSDGIPDAEDLCPNLHIDEDPYDTVTDPVTGDINHLNTDGDGSGDACDDDDDNDSVLDNSDNCRLLANADQADRDCDNTGDVCDNDQDGDGYTDAEETGAVNGFATSPTNADSDNDGISDGPDVPVCPAGLNAGPDPFPLGDPQYSISFDVFNLSGTDIKASWLPTPAWNVPDQNWDPENIRVRATLKDPNGGIIAFSGSVTFEIDYSSNHEGVAINDEEVYTTSPADDFSFNPTVSGDPSDTLQTFNAAGQTGLEIDLYAFDFGGSAVVKVTTSFSGAAVEGQIKLPLDSDNDNLPDYWEQQQAGFNAFNAHTFSAGKIDGDEDVDTSANNSYNGDGLINFRDYRGGIFDQVGTNDKYHRRFDPWSKDLFVRGDNFQNSLIKTYTSQAFPLTDADVLPFSVDYAIVYNHPAGTPNAFEEAGIQLWDVTGMPSFVNIADPMWEPPHIDILVVTNKTEKRDDGLIDTIVGLENGFINHPSSLKPRYWTWDLGGASYIGSAQFYAIFYDAATQVTKRGTEIYHLCKLNYIWNRPYMEDTNPGSCSAGYPDMLDHLDNVEDYYKENGLDPPDSKGKNKENRCITTNTLLDGDRMDPNWKNMSWSPEEYKAGLDYSSFDADGDGNVENPIVEDPSVLNPDQLDELYEYTPAQLQFHTVLHEMGHAVGMSELHTADPTCLMYQESINWSRAGHFSETAQSEILIHNKTELMP